MTLPADIFVDVNVSLAGAVADKFSFGTLLGAFAHSETANRVDGPYASVSELDDAGFDSSATPEINAWGSAVFAQDSGVDSLLIGRIDAGDLSLTASLDAIEAEAGDGGFYLLNAETRIDADIVLAAAWAEARRMLYVAQSSDADILTGAGGNIAEDLAALGYHRTGLIYHRYDDSSGGDAASDGYLDGAWSSRCGGLKVDAPAGAGTWAFKELSGVTFDPLSLAQATAIYGNDANLFGRSKGLSFTSKGTAASGRFLDVTTSLDWLTVRLEEALLELLVGAPTKIPYTSAGLNLFRGASQLVFDRGVSYGHLSPDTPATIVMPRVETVASADKAARTLTYTASAVLAGGIQRVIFNVTVEQ